MQLHELWPVVHAAGWAAIGSLLCIAGQKVVGRLGRKRIHTAASSSQTDSSRKLSLDEAIVRGLPELRKSFLNDLLQGKNFDQRDVQEKLDFYGMDFKSKSFCVLVVKVDRFDQFVRSLDVKSRILHRFEIQRICEERFQGEYELIPLDVASNRLVFVVTCPVKEEYTKDRERLFELGSEINAAVAKQYAYTTSIGIGMHYNDVLSMSHSYEEALEVLWYKNLAGDSAVLLIESMERGQRAVLQKYVEKSKQLAAILKLGDPQELLVFWEEMKRQIGEDSLFTESLQRHLYNRMITDAIQAMWEVNGEAPDEAEHRHIYAAVAAASSIDKIEQVVLAFFRKLCDFTGSIRHKSGYGYVQLALSFIERSYKQDISLTDIAGELHLNASYLSRLFKEHTGSSVVDYVNRYRIGKSRELLLENSHTSIADIAVSIGYHNEQSFRRYFKKFEGMTPGEYRIACTAPNHPSAASLT
jgi:AraC-like DNA-binding protein